MKKNILVAIGFVFIVISIWGFTTSSGECDSPLIGAGHAGDPDSETCTACHGGDENTGIAELTFSLGGEIAGYTPDSTYQIIISLTQADLDKFGFEITALNAEDENAGIFTLTDESRTRSITGFGRNYITSTPCGADALTEGYNEWSFEWTAPSEEIGVVTFYLAALAANHNHSTSGDSTYTLVQSFYKETTTGISNLNTEPKVEIYPNPISDFVEVNLKGEHIKDITIYSLSGSIINKSQYNSQATLITINTQNIQNGIYLLSVNSDINSYSQKIIIQH